MLLLMD